MLVAVAFCFLGEASNHAFSVFAAPTEEPLIHVASLQALSSGSTHQPSIAPPFRETAHGSSYPPIAPHQPGETFLPEFTGGPFAQPFGEAAPSWGSSPSRLQPNINPSEGQLLPNPEPEVSSGYATPLHRLVAANFSGSSGETSAGDPTVVEVRIIGNQRVETEQILGQIKTRVGRPFDPRIIEEDVRRLNQTRLFASVRVYWQPVPEGRIVIFEVVERPLIQYVKVVGNEWYSKKRLLEEAGIRPGDGFDPFLVEQARRKIESFYRERGFAKARVTVVEGANPNDPGIVFLISEGPRQRVLWTDFIGNTISSDSRLRTKVQTKPGWFLLWRGFFDPEQLDRDEVQIIDYYRGLGFFQAKVGEPIVHFNEDRTWARVRFIIDEGPRYKVREVRLLGNTLFSESELLPLLKLQVGKYFSQAEMDGDVKTLQEKYGSIGYVFADIRAEPRFVEQAPELELVYTIQEGVRCRVGRIDVVIKDQYNSLTHTQWSTVLNRISLAPGDIVDIRELRASERRLRASGLFEVDASRGIAPKIVVVPPEPEQVEAILARKRQGEIRGQCPESLGPFGRMPLVLRNLLLPARWFSSPSHAGESHWQADSASSPWSHPEADCFIVLRLEGKLAPGVDPAKLIEELPRAVPPNEHPPGSLHDVSTKISSKTEPTDDLAGGGRDQKDFSRKLLRVDDPTREDPVVRAQYTPDAGLSLWPLRPQPYTPRTISGGTAEGRSHPPAGNHSWRSSYLAGEDNRATNSRSPSTPGLTPVTVTSISPPEATQFSGGDPTSQSPSSVPAGNAPNPGMTLGISNNPVHGEGLPFTSPSPGSSPSVPAQQAPYPLGDGAAGISTGYPASTSSTDPQAMPSGGSFGGITPAGVIPSPTPPPTVAPDVLPLLRGDSPDQEPTLPVPLQPEVYEGRTGRIMLSAGINSDAGLIGSIIIDEQNFDWRRWPRSWEDIRSGIAWRGAGQRFRLEAVPGTEVQRYMATFQEPYLWDTDVSLGLSAFFYNRRYAEWDEDRVGGRIALGYQFTHDLSGTFAIRAAEIKIYDPAVPPGLVSDLDEVLGSNTLVGFGVTLIHDTRDSAFLPTEGHIYEISFEQVVGSFDYPRAELEVRRYLLLRQHPDGSGRHVLGLSGRVAYTGSNTPIYEHYFAGGYSSLRGFSFRGASPRDPATGLRVGGHFLVLASAEYMFPLTADDLLRLVIFCDTGAVQPDIDEWRDRYRVAPGFGFRITIPALGPAPVALDFAFPISKEDGDDRQVFSFFLGFFR